MLKYQVKRAFNILGNSGSDEAKAMKAKRQEYDKTNK